MPSLCCVKKKGNISNFGTKLEEPQRMKKKNVTRKTEFEFIISKKKKKNKKRDNNNRTKPYKSAYVHYIFGVRFKPLE